MSSSSGRKPVPRQFVGVVILTVALLVNGAVAIGAAVQTQHLYIASFLVALLLIALLLLVRGGRNLMRTSLRDS